MNRFARLCFALIVLLWGCSSRESPANQHATETHHNGENGARDAGHENEVRMSAEAAERAGIRVGRAERRALTGGVAIPAEVQFAASSTAHVGLPVAGRITQTLVGLGDNVQRGQLLGTVASSDASSARARLDQTRTRLSAAQQALARQQQLSVEGIGAQRSLIEARTLVGELRTEAEGLQRQLSVMGSGRPGELALRSPINGVVIEVHATPGETAPAEQVAFTVVDPTEVWIRGNVPELELHRVQPSSAAIVRLHAYPDLVLPGTVTYIAPSLDPRTRSLPIRVSLRTPDPRLRSGLFGTIELVGGAVDERVLVVPAEAVATLDGQTVVFVTGNEPTTFRSQAIALGRRAGGFYEVRSGIAEGASLALSGAFTLKSALRSNELAEED